MWSITVAARHNYKRGKGVVLVCVMFIVRIVCIEGKGEKGVVHD
jgi:hypothetical protein